MKITPPGGSILGGRQQAYLKPALEMRVVEMTLPDKPRSSNQRYRLTALGQHWLDTHPGGGAG
jgi:ATP-dependent DNA helicase RecG